MLNINRANISQCERSTEFKQDIVESIGNNCYIPTSGYCFIKCIKSFTNQDYTKKIAISLETRNIDQEHSFLLEFNRFVKNMISTLVVLIQSEQTRETSQKEI